MVMNAIIAVISYKSHNPTYKLFMTHNPVALEAQEQLHLCRVTVTICGVTGYITPLVGIVS